MSRLLALLLLLAVAACSPYHLVGPGQVEFTGAGKGIVSPSIAWNGRNLDRVATWTQDGADLQNLIFHLEVEDGKTLAYSLDQESKVHPFLRLLDILPDEVSFRFHRNMTEHEIMDMFSASFSKVFQNPVATSNLHPATLGGQPGFRFDYTFTGKDEVRRNGFAVGAVIDNKLTLLHYYGTQLHHFEKYRAEAEQVVGSFRFKKS